MGMTAKPTPFSQTTINWIELNCFEKVTLNVYFKAQM